MQKNDYTFKLCFGGSGGIGKTTFLHRYIQNEFLIDTKLTVGCQFHTHVLERQVGDASKRVGLVLWDLGGQERFRFIQSRYVKGTVAAFVGFDMTRINTLWETSDWIKMIRENAVSQEIPIILVGTKMDLIDSNDLDEIYQEAASFVREKDLMTFIPTSSKENTNVEETIDKMVDYLLFQCADTGKLPAANFAH